MVALELTLSRFSGLSQMFLNTRLFTSFLVHRASVLSCTEIYVKDHLAYCRRNYQEMPFYRDRLQDAPRSDGITVSVDERNPKLDR